MQDMGKSKKAGKSPLGEIISELARQQGFEKPADFAHQNKIVISTFNDLIYGKTKLFPDSLQLVADRLGVPIWELLRELATREGKVPAKVAGTRPAPPVAVDQDSHRNRRVQDLAYLVAKQEDEIEELKLQLSKKQPIGRPTIGELSPDELLIIQKIREFGRTALNSIALALIDDPKYEEGILSSSREELEALADKKPVIKRRTPRPGSIK